MPSFIDEFKHTKQKNDQLRRDLFNLAQKGDEDHTEIRLLRDVFDVPEAANKTIHNLNRNRNRNGDRDGYGYEDKGEIFENLEFQVKRELQKRI